MAKRRDVTAGRVAVPIGPESSLALYVPAERGGAWTEDIDGRSVAVRVRLVLGLTAAGYAGRFEARAFDVWASDGPELSPGVIRDLPIGDILARALTAVDDAEAPWRERTEPWYHLVRLVAAGSDAIAATGPEVELTPDEEIIVDLTLARLARQDMNRLFAERLGIKKHVAAQRVARYRQLGLLPPTERRVPR